jgi:outer membrane protein assembly factor BamA
LKNVFTKIALFFLIVIILCNCNAIKRVPNGKQLLVENKILVDGKPNKDPFFDDFVYQKPNSNILGFKLRLNLFNLAKPNPDSAYKAMFANNPAKLKRQIRFLSEKQVKQKGQSFFYSGIHKFLKKTGESPVIIEDSKTEKSALRMSAYLFNNGYFKSKIKVKTDTVGKKRGRITYEIFRNELSYIDSISLKIETPILDSLYQKSKNLSLIKSGNPYNATNFDEEKSRLTAQFRNNGAYDFQPSNIFFNIDTIGTKNKNNVEIFIKNQSVREGDSTVLKPFKLYKISRINIFTDSPSADNGQIKDSITYKYFHLYSYKKLKYKPKAITDAIFISKDGYYSDIKDNLTRRYLSNLKIFNFPSITYPLDPADSLGNSRIAKIVLSPRKKFSYGLAFDVLHSNIQDFGIAGSTSLAIRNVFNSAETFEIAARGNLGASRDLANPRNSFFNISEYGLDMKLSFPRILFPLNTDKIIPKTMIPSTLLNLGFAKQENIGLDKENFTGSMFYSWTPKRNNTARFDLFNIQYVKNINVQNYFNVYSSSYNALNNFAKIYGTDQINLDNNNNLTITGGGANNFINDVLNDPSSVSEADFRSIRSIEERRIRLTENNLILASTYQFSKTTRSGLSDNDFFTIKTKIEAAGNVLSLFAAASKGLDNEQNKKKIFNIEYSQYVKGEFEYIKHWDLSNEKVFAVRGFVGLAVPYGNSTNIPFSRSYFAGGSNDIRAWQPYSLGPGSSGGINDFNEANLKIATSAELRFKILNDLKGALFVDAGNIWNVFDDVKDKPSVFENLKSLRDIAVGTGFGFRYDLNFFVFRVDLGYKTYNPSYAENERWLRDINFSKTVLNIGINYPF